MKLSKYLSDFTNQVILTDQAVINSSEMSFKNNQLTLNGELVFLLYINNFSGKLTINVKTKSVVSLYIVYGISKQTTFDLTINVEKDSQLKSFSNLNSKNQTKFKLRENINIEDNSKVELDDSLTFNGNLQMNQKVFLNGPVSEIAINSLNIGYKTNQSQVKQEIFHQAKSTVSNISNSLITLDEANLNYQVIGKIEKGMEYSRCSQKNKGIMLSEFSVIACEPTLLIDEYNVEASHGAAIGKMDDLQLFYLLSRGLSETEARALILSGYTNPFIDLIDDKNIKKNITAKINRLLRRA